MITTFFRDGIQTGDFSRWTAAQTGGGGTINPSAVQSHHGTWSMLSTGQLGGEYGRGRQDLAPGEPIVFLRSCVYFVNLPFAGDRTVYLSNVRGPLGGGIANAGLRYDGSNYMWRLNYFGAGAMHNLFSSVITPLTGHWYYVELGTVVHASAGEVHLYIDGSHVINLTGVKTDDRGNVEQLLCGINDIAGNLAGVISVYSDCFIACDAYVGTTAIWELDPAIAVPHASL